MAIFIHLIVKGLSAAYLLHRLFRFLFREQMQDFWRFLTPEVKSKETPVTPQVKLESAAYSVVGKSQTVYLEKPPENKPVEPAFSEDLQKSPVYEEEPDIAANDVDNDPNEEILSPEERFLPLDAEPDTEAVSTGMTYEQISQALDVVRGKQTDEAGKTATARILYEIQGSDVFDFLAAQAENEAVIEKLIKDNIDNDGISLLKNTRKQRLEIEEFDMAKYV